MRVNTRIQSALGLATISPDQIELIHSATLDILNRVGVEVQDEEALELLRAGGARVDGQRARIPAWMVQAALQSAPSQVVLCRRDKRPALYLEKNRIYYGTGSDTPNTVDIEDGRVRPATKQDIANVGRICDALENIDFVMSLGLASDVPGDKNDIHQFEALVLNTAKPIVYTAHNRECLADILAMAEIVAGGPEALATYPFLCLYNQPASPLRHGRESVQKLLLCAERRVPMNYTVAVMMGGTGPVTLAGALVVANCELLSGLVMHQLKGPGAPIVYGGGVPPLDMATSVSSYGAPEVQLGCATLAAMARYYGLPSFTAAGCSDAQVFDQQAGMEAGYSILMAGLSGANMIHDNGYLGAGMIASMEMLTLCNETIGVVKHLLKGVEVTSETLASEVIESVGPGGNYFAEDHTFRHFKHSLHIPELLNRANFDQWQQAGASTYGQRANQKVKEILKNHCAPELPADRVAALKAISEK